MLERGLHGAMMLAFELAGCALVASLIVFTVWWFLYCWTGRFEPTPAEVGHRPDLTTRTGIGMTMHHATLTFVRLSTYDDFVAIVPACEAPIVLRRSDRVEIKRRGLMSNTIRMRVMNRLIPIVHDIYPRDADVVEAALRCSLDPHGETRTGWMVRRARPDDPRLRSSCVPPGTRSRCAWSLLVVAELATVRRSEGLRR